MGFVHIRGEDGQLHLIHTSQINPGPRKPIALGDWPDVWRDFTVRSYSMPATEPTTIDKALTILDAVKPFLMAVAHRIEGSEDLPDNASVPISVSLGACRALIRAVELA